jgi:SPP1 family phage portal protein
MITRGRELPIDATLMNDCIKQFDLDKSRLARLYAYYIGWHDIIERERTTGLPNNMLVHAYPHYIATMTSGYLIGDPVQYSDDKQEKALEAIMEAYAAADTPSIDSELALHQAIYGRGVELSYMNPQSQPRVTALDPQNAFVVYDDTAEALPLFGVHRLMGTGSDGLAYVKKITLYTDRDYTEFTTDTNGYADGVGEPVAHNFGIVPMVEYWNNSVQMGDFEPVISLIDAYDILQSDRVNDKEQFADALLVLTGVVGLSAAEDTEDTRTAAQRLKEERTLSLPDVGARAEYLLKNANEADTDILRQSIKSDIHKFSQVPDMTDQEFAGNSSGVAMKYKLLGLEQATKIKERWFREGLKWRLRLFANILSLKGKPSLDADKVNIMFRRSLPVNDLEIAQTVQYLQGIVPDNLLLAQVPFVDDVAQAQDDLDEQKAKGIAAQAATFGAYPNANEDNSNEDVLSKG